MPTKAPTRDDSIRDILYQALMRDTRAQLMTKYLTGFQAADGRTIRYRGGPRPIEAWRKDEIVSSILDDLLAPDGSLR